jgi:small membrane protein
MAIRVILIGGLLLLTLCALLALRSRLATRLFLAVQLLGVGRGTDLLFYLAVLAGYAAILVILAKFRRLERQITLLTREIAILTARREDDESSNSSPKAP